MRCYQFKILITFILLLRHSIFNQSQLTPHSPASKQRVYIACARQIKRIDSIQRSPIYAFFSETLTGTSSIRAFQEQERFVRRSDQLLDDSQRVWFEVFSSNRWDGLFISLLLISLLLLLYIFVLHNKSIINRPIIINKLINK